MSHKVGEEYVENTWVCSSCKMENPGRSLECHCCGSKKEVHEKYDTSANYAAEAVTDTAQLEIAAGGANWHCAYCGSDVRNASGECANCGGDREEANKKKAAKERCAAALPPPPSPPIARHYPIRDSLPPRRGSSTLKTVIMVAVGLIAVGLLVWLAVYFLAPRKVEAKVAGVAWSCETRLYRRTMQSGEGWRDGEPAGAFNESCVSKQDGTVRCNPHDCNPHPETYECRPHDCNERTESYNCRPHDCNCRRENCRDQGNGYSKCDKVCDTCYDTCTRTVHDTCYDTCTRTVYDTCYDQCPNMRDWCSYNYYVQNLVNAERLAGSDNAVRCPDLQANGPDESVKVDEDRRVTFRSGDDSWSYAPSNRTEFQRFTPGSPWNIEVNRLGTVTKITAPNTAKK